MCNLKQTIEISVFNFNLFKFFSNFTKSFIFRLNRALLKTANENLCFWKTFIHMKNHKLWNDSSIEQKNVQIYYRIIFNQKPFYI